jgi:formate dehydrogenase subunit gamma
MITRVPWNEEQAEQIVTSLAGQEGATLVILHALQNVFGFIPDAAIPMVARALNLTRAEIFGVVTFYHDFRRAPAGRHVLKLCRAEACQSMGADALAEQAKARLKIDWHQTTGDESVTLEPVFCLGFCATAPSALADGKPVSRLDSARLDKILDAMQ